MRIFGIERRWHLVPGRSILTTSRRSFLRPDFILHLVGNSLLHIRTETRCCRWRSTAGAQHIGAINGLEVRCDQRIRRP